MTLRILIHNVGHGQSVHAFSPAGEVVVIDLGCSESFSPLEWLRRQTSTIDSLIITHPHGDHIDEMLKLEELGFSVRQLWRPNWLAKEDVYRQNQTSFGSKLDAYYKFSDMYNSPILDEELVGNPTVSGGMSMAKFASRNCGVSNINNHSGVVVFSYCESKVIIPGDNEPPSWALLQEQEHFQSTVINADIFMASHHGRKSGYNSELFQLFKPSLCVISDSRVQDTDAADRYSHHAKGWKVHRRGDGESEKRYCITTRNDGFVDIQIGKNFDGNNFLSVTID